jgi:hypothetical protein
MNPKLKLALEIANMYFEDANVIGYLVENEITNNDLIQLADYLSNEISKIQDQEFNEQYSEHVIKTLSINIPVIQDVIISDNTIEEYNSLTVQHLKNSDEKTLSNIKEIARVGMKFQLKYAYLALQQIYNTSAHIMY